MEFYTESFHPSTYNMEPMVEAPPPPPPAPAKAPQANSDFPYPLTPFYFRKISKRVWGVFDASNPKKVGPLETHDTERSAIDSVAELNFTLCMNSFTDLLEDAKLVFLDKPGNGYGYYTKERIEDFLKTVNEMLSLEAAN